VAINEHDSMREETEQGIANIMDNTRVEAILKKYYLRFGVKVCQVMRNYLSMPSGLNRLIRKMSLDVNAPGEDARHKAVTAWITARGNRAFIEMYGGDFADPGNVPPAIRPVEPCTRNETPPPVETVKAPAQPEKSATPIAEMLRQIIKPSESGQDVAKASEGKTWPEVDRRSGKDRRENQDRRNSVDVIFKNKRFGGERRSGKDRRQNGKSNKG